MLCTFIISRFAWVFFWVLGCIALTLFFFCHLLPAGGKFTLLCLVISFNAWIFFWVLQCLGSKFILCHQHPAGGWFNLLCLVHLSSAYSLEFFFLSFEVYWFTLFFFCHQLPAGGEFTLLCLFISLNAGIFSGFCSVWVQNFLFVISFPLTVRLISCVVCVFFFFDKV